MRRWGSAGLAALLWLGTATSVVSAQDGPRYRPGRDSPVKGWMSSSKPKPDDPRADPKAKAPANEPKPASRDERSKEQDRLMKAYLRRHQVCDRLSEIALETSNLALGEEARRLEKLAWQIYQEQSSRLLGVDAAGLEAEPALSARPSASSLGARATRGPLLTPGQPGSTGEGIR